MGPGSILVSFSPLVQVFFPLFAVSAPAGAPVGRLANSKVKE